MSKYGFQCEECGCKRYSDIEGWGKDEYGEFVDYWCEDCGALITVYANEE